MKKIGLLLLSFAFFTTLQAQADNSETIKQDFINTHKTKLAEKALITEAVSLKVINITWAYLAMAQAPANVNLPAAERAKRQQEILEAENKEFRAIPLTEAQLTAVRAYFKKALSPE